MVRLDGAGTPEATWRTWEAPSAWPDFGFGAPGRVVVVAPHPDDETFGVGGLLHDLRVAGWHVEIVAVTDGEGSHPGSRTVSPAALVGRRAAEREGALGHLGLDTAPVHRLGLPDAQVTAHEDALTELLGGLLPGTDLCLTTWAHDGHADHEATGRATARAAAGVEVLMVSFPIWMWDWATPEDPRVPWARARRVTLSPAACTAKRAAAQMFLSQTQPLEAGRGDATIVPPGMLAHLTRAWETLLT
ncbi:MAG: PIG-L family deacetylase [Euzebyales bacterium]|nr:PIG-L family deacetylase [Euzebyales bacterium]